MGLRDVPRTSKGSQAYFRPKVAMASKHRLVLGDTLPVVTRNTKLERVWGDMLSDEPIDYGDPNRWRSKDKIPDIRPSSFPFCERRDGFEHGGITPPKDFVVKSNLYTEQGKAIHYVVQNALARGTGLFGRWTCANPRCKDPNPREGLNHDKTWSSDTPSLRPTFPCPICKVENAWEYQELSVYLPDINLRGHTDGVFIKKQHSSILEVKSAGKEKVEKLKEMSNEELDILWRETAPYFGYFWQASSYAVLIQEEYNIQPHIDRVDYLICSRDDPETYFSCTIMLPEQKSIWWQDVYSRIKRAQKARGLNVLPLGFAYDQQGVNTLPTCKYCPHKDYCLDDAEIKRKARFICDEFFEPERAKALLDGED